MKLVCPKCGAHYEKGKFCGECGTQLVEVAVKKVLYCSVCQVEVAKGKFCPECGSKLEEREVEIKAEQSTPAETSLKFEAAAVPEENKEVEAILAKYRDEYGDMRTLNPEEYAIAAEELQKCVDLGNAEAMCFLSTMYIFGIGVMHDTKKGYNLAVDAENKGSKYATAIIGICYANGIEVVKNEEEAIRRLTDGYQATRIPGLAGAISSFYVGQNDYANALQYAQEAAEKGDKDGFTTLGTLYLNGWGVNKDEQLAFENYMQAAAQGHEGALNQIGWMYLEGFGVDKDLDQAFIWFNEAAKKNSGVGMYNVACCYRDGVGVEQDFEKAAEWYKKSAEAGYVDAMFELGKYYLSVLVDFDKAKMWLTKASEKGNAEAMNVLGVHYCETEKDYTEAIKWYKKAIVLNHPIAYRNLALCYRDGTGVKKDDKKAQELLAKAAEFGVDDAEDIKTDIVASEDDARIDEANDLLTNKNKQRKAVLIYKELADKGNVRAQGNYGNCLLNGWGVKQSLKEGVAWLEKGAKKESAWCCLRLAEAYAGQNYNGKNITVDLKKAKEYLTKAKEYGADETEIHRIEELTIKSVVISNENVNKDITNNGQLGIEVTFKMVANGMVGRKLNLSAYCVNKNDDKKCLSKPGNSTGINYNCRYVEICSPEYPSTEWESFKFFISYSNILNIQASFDETLVIIAWDQTDKKPAVLARVDLPYHISCKTHVFRSNEWEFHLLKKKLI